MDSVVDIRRVLLLLLLLPVWGWRCCCVAAGRKEEGEKPLVVEGRRRRRTPRRRAGRGGSGRVMVMLLGPRSLWLIRRCCVVRASVEGEEAKNNRLCSRDQQRPWLLACCVVMSSGNVCGVCELR